MARTYRLMSSDGHLEVPPERWVHRVPQQYRDRAPHTIHLPDGGDALMIEGQPLLEANFLDLRAGRPAGQWQPFGIKVEDAAGTGSAEQRVKEQDIDGMDAEVLFPAMVAGPAFWRNISHDEVYKAVIRAYNDWLGEEYCAVAPDRLLGMGVMPITNADDAVAEMQHCARLGLKGIQLGALPNGKGYPTPEDDKFWAAAVDMDMPVTVHVAFNRTGARASQPTFKYPTGRSTDHGAYPTALPRMADEFRSAPGSEHYATGTGRRVRPLPDVEGILRRNPAGMGALLVRARRLVVPAAHRLGREHARLQTPETLAQRVCAGAHILHRAIRASGHRVAAACRGGPHHVCHRFPAHRVRMAQFPPDHRQDLRRCSGGGTGQNLGRQCGGIFQTDIDSPGPASAIVKYSSVMMRSYRALDRLAAIARVVRRQNLKDGSEGMAVLAMAQGCTHATPL